MKKMFRNLMLVAVAAMAFVSCQNEGVEEVVRPQEVAMTIIADVDDTRTVIDEENDRVNWSEGDALKVIENSAIYRTTTAINIDSNGKAQFTVSFPENTEATSFTYNAIYPASAVVEDDADKVTAEKVKVIVKDQQMATATSFDPAADILVSKQIETEAQPTELNMQFKRLVALGKMTLNDLPADAAIEKVIFTAGADDVVAGRNYVNATTGEVLEYGYFGNANALTISYDEPIETRDIYFACNPFEMEAGETFKVKAVCGDKSYTREVEIPAGRSLKFTEGNLGTFSVDMKNATVETNVAFTEGKYVVIAKNGSKYYAMKGVKGTGNFMTYSEVSYDGAATTFATDDETLVWSIAAVDGGYTLKNNEGKYLYGSNSGNYAYLGNAQTLTITPVEDTTQQYKIAIQSISERILAFNTNSGQERFAFYKGTQANKLYLVPFGENTDPYFTVTPTEYTFEANGREHCFYVEPHNGYDGDVTATTTAEDWLTIDQDGYMFCVEADSNDGKAREATITFTDGNKSVTVTVKQEGKAITSISEALESADATAVKFENVTVAATYTKGVLVTDGTAYILVYKNSEISDAVIGSVVTVEGTMGTYGGLRQVASPTVEIKDSTNYQHPDAKVFDAEDFEAFISSPSVMYVEYTGTLSITGNYYNVTIEGTEKQGSISYPKSGVVSADDNGKKITVRGYTIGVSSSKYVNTMLVDYDVVTGGDEGDGNIGKPWSYEWTSNTNKITKNGTTTVNGLAWTLTTTASNYAWDSSNGRGWQVGTAAGNVVLSTSDYSGGVTKVVLMLSTNGSNNTASVSVGGTTFGEAQTIVSGTTNANKLYTFKSTTPCSGEIKITLNDSNKSVYFKAISIN